jgi:CRP-like cAMP-binding protein
MPPSQAFSQSPNRILSRLSRGDARLLEPHLEAIALPLRKKLENRNRRIDHVYFVESGIASVVAGANGVRGIEVGIIGLEGVTGLAVLMGSDRSPHDTYMQVGGRGQCMRATNLRLRMAESITLRDTLMKYGFSFYVQTSHTALANGRGKIEDRLARWLLMADDRGSSGELHVTHEFLALMLGVRRPGVTLALKLLEQKALIRCERSAITMVDRAGLEKTSNGAYGVAEGEYRRLLG